MRISAAQFTALALLFLAGTAAGEPVPLQPEPPHEPSAADLEGFLDPLFKEQLEKYEIAGAVISVLKDGHIVFAKGHGYANQAARYRR